jgi:hypothetical protein
VLFAEISPYNLEHSAAFELKNVYFARISIHQVDVTEWRSQLWNRGLSSQAVDDMDLARVCTKSS